MSGRRLVLYQHPFAAYCQKVLVALYELDLPFDTELIEGEDGRAMLAAVWPIAGMPVLRDDVADLIVPESSTIIEHLDGFVADRSRLIPRDPPAALQARLWDRFHDQYVATPMQKIVGDQLRPEGRKDPEGVDDARRALDTAYAVLEEQLAGRPWTAGAAFGLADCAAAPALFYARVVHRWDEEQHANITRYYRELATRPSFARVIDEARAYRDLFPLPWPADVDEPHLASSEDDL
jgi:glutathione S-transferase